MAYLSKSSVLGWGNIYSLNDLSQHVRALIQTNAVRARQFCSFLQHNLNVMVVSSHQRALAVLPLCLCNLLNKSLWLERQRETKVYLIGRLFSANHSPHLLLNSTWRRRDVSIWRRPERSLSRRHKKYCKITCNLSIVRVQMRLYSSINVDELQLEYHALLEARHFSLTALSASLAC